MDRTAGAISRKLGNIASLDPRHQARGVGGPTNSSKLDRKVWTEFQDNWSGMAEKSESAFETLKGGAGLGETFLTHWGIQQPSGPSEVEQMVKVRRLQNFSGMPFYLVTKNAALSQG